jgi:hypothetical protein
MEYFKQNKIALFRGIYDSNLFAALYDVIGVRFRSTASGIMLMFAFIVGSISPLVLGIIKPKIGLSNGLAYLSLFYVFAAMCIGLALVFFIKEIRCDFPVISIQ